MFARHVLARRAARFPKLKDGQILADLADAVIDDLEKRSGPVARYVARAKTISEAATAVRRYITRAILRRSNARVESMFAAHKGVPSSTARRWRRDKDLAAVIEGGIDDAAIRPLMRQRQTGVEDGRVSEQRLAHHLNRSRSVIQRALARAEVRFGFQTERGRGNTAQLTPTQVRQVRECLPAQKPGLRRRRPKSG